MSRDVTDRVRAEEKLQESMAALTRANEDLKNFTHIVSHDLRSPLINIKGFVAELDRALTDVRAMLTHMIDLDDVRLDAVDAIFNIRAKRAMEFISMATTKMDTLLNAVLQISRLGRRDPVIEPVDVRELVLREVEALAFQIRETATEVVVGALPTVQADRPTLELVFRNLLSNAIKYLVPGRPGRIEVTAETKDRVVEFHVRDNGRGIAERHLAKVFAIFQRVGDQTVPGEGVGLTYVETALRRCGGTIRVESQPGEGSTFSVTIPGGTLDPPVTTSGS